MRLIQFLNTDGSRQVGLVQDGDSIVPLRDTSYVYNLALDAYSQGVSLSDLVKSRFSDESIAYAPLLAENRLLPPLDHPDPARLTITGTGLTHLGSAESRNAMHEKLTETEETLTDSMRMFKLGLDGGKPAEGDVGVSPEWFYKGNGTWLVAPGQPLELPAFADDGGEEAEIAGLYLIAPDGVVLRVGFALANEYSDHVFERQNYLYLAHSKLRTSSIGPELLVGDLPDSVSGTVRILRKGQEIWSGPFLTGEANMSHSLANMEHHHFKYARFRQSGEVHVHYFGTATLSFSAGIKTQPGDIFEIEATAFGKPLRNPLVQTEAGAELVEVKGL